MTDFTKSFSLLWKRAKDDLRSYDEELSNQVITAGKKAANPYRTDQNRGFKKFAKLLPEWTERLHAGSIVAAGYLHAILPHVSVLPKSNDTAKNIIQGAVSRVNYNGEFDVSLLAGLVASTETAPQFSDKILDNKVIRPLLRSTFLYDNIIADTPALNHFKQILDLIAEDAADMDKIPDWTCWNDVPDDLAAITKALGSDQGEDTLTPERHALDTIQSLKRWINEQPGLKAYLERHTETQHPALNVGEVT